MTDDAQKLSKEELMKLGGYRIYWMRPERSYRPDKVLIALACGFGFGRGGCNHPDGEHSTNLVALIVAALVYGVLVGFFTWPILAIAYLSHLKVESVR